MTLHDARTLEDGAALEADLLIIGGGAAGITLGRVFAGGPLRVILLESGDERFDHGAQLLYRGATAGVPTYPLTHSRFRMLGGSTTRWTGQCAKLDPIDFETREGIAGSGWPFDHVHLEPWYSRATEIARLTTNHFDPEAWVDGDGSVLPLAGGCLALRVLQFGYPRDFAKIYRNELAASANVEVLLNANALALTTTPDLGRVTGVRVGTLANTRFHCTARITVLAAGGIENPRLLLASSDRAPAGLGNEHDLVGRYFMDHPYCTTGWFEPAAPPFDRGLHVVEDFAHAGIQQKAHVAFTLNPALQRRENLNGAGAYFIRQARWRTEPAYYAPGGKAVVHVAELLRHQTVPDRHTPGHLANLVRDWRAAATTLTRSIREAARTCLALRTVLETTPCAESRVTLSRARDRLGVPRVEVDWRINPADRRGLDRLRTVLAAQIARRGLGRLVEDPALNEAGWPASMVGGKHHMGTTRMHEDPKRGVVDPDLRLHGIQDLYVAGSSVFPTSSWANPTLTIIALALRLGDHLAARLGTPPPAAPGRALDAPGQRLNKDAARLQAQQEGTG